MEEAVPAASSSGAAVAGSSSQPAVPATAAQPGDSPLLTLAQLRQLFFDQPCQLPELQQRYAELWQLRASLLLVNAQKLWDQLLLHMHRYIRLLEEQQQEAASQQEQIEEGGQGAPAKQAAAEAFVPTCGLCMQPRADGAELRRMQVRSWPSIRLSAGFLPAPQSLIRIALRWSAGSAGSTQLGTF